MGESSGSYHGGGELIVYAIPSLILLKTNPLFLPNADIS